MGHNYLECIGAQELERLRAQHAAWLPETHAFLKDAGIFSAQRVVEFGSGPGLTTLDLAAANPQSEITAVDISDYYLNHLRSKVEEERIKQITVIKQSAAEPISVGNFDAAFCRWFLAWVTSEVDVVLANIHRSLRPGGVFAAMEYLTLRSVVQSPPLPALQRYLAAWEGFYRQAGGTTEIGTTLVDRLTAAGFKVESIRCVGGLSRSGERLFQWWRRLFDEFGSKFCDKELLSFEEWSEIKAYWEQQGSKPNSFIHSPLILQITATKR